MAACRAFAVHKLDFGFAGHLTIRDPEQPELYWTNPMCVHFSQVRLSNLILVDHTGRVAEGRYAVNRAGFVLHAAVHAENPDILAMCHAHTVYGTAYAALGRPLPPVTQDACAFFEDHAVITKEAGQVAVEEQAGRSVCSYFKDVKAVIHQSHGLFTSSRHSIDAAASGSWRWSVAASSSWRSTPAATRRAWCRPTRPATAASTWAATTSAGCTSSRSSNSFGPRNPTCSTESFAGRGGLNGLACRTPMGYTFGRCSLAPEPGFVESATFARRARKVSSHWVRTADSSWSSAAVGGAPLPVAYAAQAAATRPSVSRTLSLASRHVDSSLLIVATVRC